MIRITDLHKTFNPGTVTEVRALQGITLEAARGDFITIIGTNGSGKSTLLNAVAGNFLPDSGTIEIDGDDLTRAADFQRAKKISRVFQDPFKGTAPEMTIAENLHMAFLRGKSRLPKIGLTSAQRRDYREKLKGLEMGLEDRMDNRVGTLSGGQRQALTLLMSVIVEPKVLLLDEHTAALDPKSADQVIRLTREFIDKWNLTSIMITHSMQQALSLGNRTIMMHQGKIIDDIPARDKQRLLVEDLLGKFADLRKQDQLTDEMLLELRRNYL